MADCFYFERHLMERQLSVTLMCHKVYVFANSERLNDIKLLSTVFQQMHSNEKQLLVPEVLDFT